MSTFQFSEFDRSDASQSASWQSSGPRGVDCLHADVGTSSGSSQSHGQRHVGMPPAYPGSYQAGAHQTGPYQVGSSRAVATADGRWAAGWAPSRATNVLAIISLVTGILCFAIVPVVLGHLALAQIKRSGESGTSLALIGMVLGYLQIIAYVIFFLIFGVGIFWAVNS